MDRAAKIKRARELRAQNITCREIGERIGETRYWVEGQTWDIEVQKECPGCGTDLTGTHGKTKWCSERCRKNTLCSGVCIDCGGKTSGRSSGLDRIPERCSGCARNVKAERNELLREMWEADEPTWYIAQRLGMTETAVIAWVDSERRVRGDSTLPLRRLGGGAAERRKRHRRMIKLRRRGLNNGEIAEAVGMASAAAVSVAFRKMRDKGWDVPPSPVKQGVAA